MKKIIPVFVLILICVSISNCKKETFTKFPAPAWQPDDVGKYAASMTAVVRLPDKLTKTLGANDQLGAFINDECRGTGELITVDTASVFFIMIHGTTTEDVSVVFKYYCTQNSYMYTSVDSLKFAIDGNYGTADAPIVLRLKAMK